MNRLLALVALLVMLTACSGPSDSASEPEASPSNAETSETPTSPAPTALPTNLAPGSVQSFSCNQGEDDRWLATGTLLNDSKAPVRHRITVFLGSGEGTAHSTELPAIAPGKTKKFSLGLMPPADPKATCRIQVEVLQD